MSQSSRHDFQENYHIVVIGGGLVGLHFAICARRAGFLVSVFDQDAELKEIGAGIILPPNATRTFSQLGLLERVQARSSVVRDWVSHSYRDGTAPLAKLHLDPNIRQQFGFPYLVIYRADLRNILYQAAIECGVVVHLGWKVDVTQTDFKQRVVYASNVSNLTNAPKNEVRNVKGFHADLVVAADGQASEAREYMAGRQSSPRPTGKAVNRVVIEKSRMQELGIEDLADPPCVHIWFGHRQLGVAYMLKDVFNVALAVETAYPESTGLDEPDDELYIGPRPVKNETLKRAFSGNWDHRIQKIVANGHGFLKWLLLDYGHDEPESWFCCKKPTNNSSGPENDSESLYLVLCGDSAHAIEPYIGCGAALGFESASLLGYLLEMTSSRSAIPSTLRQYERLRRPRTRLVKDMTAKMGNDWMLPEGELQRERDRICRDQNDRPLAGFPNALQDPFFGEWLFAYDALEEAKKACTKDGPREDMSNHKKQSGGILT